ncbi:fasciclin-3-like [Anopheles ziemanni]|uniref:fasciclin-3-like n=1 Tax=Anopheles coustani TaxID=139045 RepID=UPI0026595220|nr:fasciclin-3-like [Anopheles coustani]XP_058171772.1 fasciclin-3-like [Anopheles ziemanni]
MRRYLGLLVTLYSCYSLVAPVYSQADIETEPESNTYFDKYERDVKLVCRAGKPIERCRIRLPGSTEPYETSSLPTGVTSYGNLADGECGVKLARLSAERTGKFECLVTIGGQEYEKSIVYGIRTAPQPTVLIISKNTNLVDSGIRANQMLKARCTSKFGLPAANLTWMMDGMPVEERFLKPAQITDELQNGRLMQTISQEVNIYLTPEDNGKTLVCHASHPALTNPQRSVLLLNVKFAPLEFPHILIDQLPKTGSAIINVTIHANPQPVTRWTVNGRMIKEGESVDMYQAYIPHATSKAGEYTVLLKNNDCGDEHASLFTLEATNILGTQTYVVKAVLVNDEGENAVGERLGDDSNGSTFWLISVWTFFCSMLATRLL